MTIYFDNGQTGDATIKPALGPGLALAASLRDVQAELHTGEHDLVVVGPDVDTEVGCSLAAELRVAGSAVGVVLICRELTSAVLQAAMVAGVREVVSSDDLPTLTAACQRSGEVSRQMRPRLPVPQAASSAPGQIVTVFAAKGGCGKTTVSTNLAATFARAGRRTCLVDLDLAFGDVAIAMALKPVRTIADAIGLSALDETAVRSLVTRHHSGLDAILAPIEPGTAEGISSDLVGNLLEVLQTMYDVVVVDTPPAFTEHVLVSFDKADHCVLITTLDVPALKNLKLTLETLEMLDYPRERWHVVLNRADAKVGLSAQDVEQTLRTTISVQIPSSRAIPATVNRGVPIVLDQPGHAVSLAFRRLADSLTEAPSGRPSKAGRRGLLRRRKVQVSS